MRKSESLRIYGYLSRGAYRRVKKQHASPRMTKNLRQPYEYLTPVPPTLGELVGGCYQASKSPKSLCWEYKPKHLDTFSKLYIDTIRIPQRIILLAHLCNMQNHKT